MADPVKVEAALNAVLDLAQKWIEESERYLVISATDPRADVRAQAHVAGKTQFYAAKAIIDAANKELNG